jgi:hypothetical protein
MPGVRQVVRHLNLGNLGVSVLLASSSTRCATFSSVATYLSSSLVDIIGLHPSSLLLLGVSFPLAAAL